LPVGQSGFPTKKEISIATKLNIYTVKTLLGGLVDNGKLVMHGNWYHFSKMVSDEQTQDYIKAITEENKHNSDEIYSSNIEMPKQFKNKIESFSILRWVMLIVGIGSGIMSAYYTQIWQHETLNIFWSWFLSLIMIGFSSAAFLTLIGILKKTLKIDWKNIFIAIIFTILWLICLIYSIQVTVAGRFSQYQEIVLQNNIKENNNVVVKVKINNLLDSINSLKLEKNNNQIRLNTLLKQADDIQKGMVIKDETWLTIQNRILNVQNIIFNANKLIENKNIEYENFIENNNEINSNESKFGFYDWAAKVYKTDKNNIEFIMILFPSLFLDVASPIALAVFMFLGRKKDENSL
jgi:hypothetical protein